MTGILTFLVSKKRIVAGAAALAVLATTSVTVPLFSGDGGVLLARASDALQRFVDRSPGERGETDLIKTKVKRDFGGPASARALGPQRDAPEERALGKIFDTPPEEAVEQLSDNPLGPLALADPDPPLIPLGDTRTFDGTPTGPGFPGGISTVVPPIATDPGDPTIPVDPAPPVTGAVPEPETWALMILGFALCGAAMRRRNSLSRGYPDCA